MDWKTLSQKLNLDVTFTTQTEQFLVIVLCIVTGLLFISFIRIILLLRQRRKMERSAERLERQILDQQREMVANRTETAAWRGEMQRMFDAFRADASKRLEDAEARATALQSRMDIATKAYDRRVFELEASLEVSRQMCAELPQAKARVVELESLLVESGRTAAMNGASLYSADEMKSLADATKSVSALPVLPSMETLATQGPGTSDGSAGLDAMRENLAVTQLQNAELQRALMLARRQKAQTRRTKGR